MRLWFERDNPLSKLPHVPRIDAVVCTDVKSDEILSAEAIEQMQLRLSMPPILRGFSPEPDPSGQGIGNAEHRIPLIL